MTVCISKREDNYYFSYGHYFMAEEHKFSQHVMLISASGGYVNTWHQRNNWYTDVQMSMPVTDSEDSSTGISNFFIWQVVLVKLHQSCSLSNNIKMMTSAKVNVVQIRDFVRMPALCQLHFVITTICAGTMANKQINCNTKNECAPCSK